MFSRILHFSKLDESSNKINAELSKNNWNKMYPHFFPDFIPPPPRGKFIHGKIKKNLFVN